MAYIYPVPITDSPVEKRRKEIENGNGDWSGYDYVYSKIQEGCHKMAKTKYVYLSDDHIDSMADLGSGNEERMKYRLAWMREFNWIK
jgi:hypothetical protein